MNNARRKEIDKVIEELELLKERIEQIQSDEGDYANSIPENMTEKIEVADMTEATISEAADGVQEAIDKLTESKTIGE